MLKDHISESVSRTFSPINKVKTNSATPKEDSFVNIRKNILLAHPRLHTIKGWGLPKGNDQINLVGGGPTIKKTISELITQSGPIVACGSSYDWLVENGVIPDYCVICDPDPVCLNYITKAHHHTIFLIATQCDEVIFECLKHYTVYMWHCYNEDKEGFLAIEKDFQAVGGGCTVGLRALSISIMMGYNNIHFFGFDSCLSDEEHHAYSFSSENEYLGDIYTIKVGTDTELSGEAKEYKSAGYQMAQVQHFMDFYEHYIKFMIPTSHGESLFTDVVNNMKATYTQKGII
jgi:hypothetical protein